MRSFRELFSQMSIVELAFAVAAGLACVDLIFAVSRDVVQVAVLPTLLGPSAGSPLQTDASQVFARDSLPAFLMFVLVMLVAGFGLAVREQQCEKSQRACPECLSKIPIEASRCAFCTALVLHDGERPMH